MNDSGWANSCKALSGMSRPSELAAQRARYAPVFAALGDPTGLRCSRG